MRTEPATDARSAPFTARHFALSIIPFVVLCTMNAAGYRYGASDQALYTPAVLRHLDPTLFPHDRARIDTQARLMLSDEVIAGLVRLTAASLPTFTSHSTSLRSPFCSPPLFGSACASIAVEGR